MQSLIVGIDPGTTLALAALDLEGNLVHISSYRKHDLGFIIAKLIELGKPLILATDKKNTPLTVQKLATRLGAIVHAPSADLQKLEKKDLVTIKTNNAHEFDALAAAQHAFVAHQHIIQKTKLVLSKKGEIALFEEVIEFLIKHNELSISHALASLQEPELIPKENPTPKTIIHKAPKLEEHIARLDAKIAELTRTNKQLQEQQARMQRALKRKLVAQPRNDQLHTAHKKIKQLEAQIHKQEQRFKGFKQFIDQLSDDHVLIKKVPFLSKKQRKDTILFVENPSIRPQQLEHFMPNLRIIITQKPPRQHDRYVYIAADQLPHTCFDTYIMVKKDDLDKQLQSSQLLKEVIRQYQHQRKLTLEKSHPYT